jgi:hypothetical protein
MYRQLEIKRALGLVPPPCIKKKKLKTFWAKKALNGHLYTWSNIVCKFILVEKCLKDVNVWDQSRARTHVTKLTMIWRQRCDSSHINCVKSITKSSWDATFCMREHDELDSYNDFFMIKPYGHNMTTLWTWWTRLIQ